LLKPAYDKSREKTDLLGGLLSKDLQIWQVSANLIPVAGIVTRLLRESTSGNLHCRIWLVGGSRLSEWAPDFIEKLIPWAKAEGCTEINGSGRKGWRRIVAHFGGVEEGEEDGLPVWRLSL
jgi:hypothetical protein